VAAAGRRRGGGEERGGGAGAGRRRARAAAAGRGGGGVVAGRRRGGGWVKKRRVIHLTFNFWNLICSFVFNFIFCCSFLSVIVVRFDLFDSICSISFVRYDFY
jgi:hypothetical protein